MLDLLFGGGQNWRQYRSDVAGTAAAVIAGSFHNAMMLSDSKRTDELTHSRSGVRKSLNTATVRWWISRYETALADIDTTVNYDKKTLSEIYIL